MTHALVTARRLMVAALTITLALTMVQLPLADASERELEATIRTTTYGIPHILADDHESAGFGYGYAFARDAICVMAESYVTVRGERSRYFGPDDSYVIHGNGSVNNNLNSDFFHQRIIDRGIVEDLLAQDPPHGPREEIREATRGYAAGYNHYLREVGGADGIDDPTCRGEEWVREIDELDVYLRFYHLILIASQGVAIDGIGGAEPPTPPVTGDGDGADGSAVLDNAAIAELGEAFDQLRSLGSNAYGLGRDATDNGRGMLLGNPHFPWQGPERFYQAQVTIPGVMNSSGMSLYGVPINLIGFNEDVAWSHTVSTAFRFTPFELTLVPGSPTTYMTDEGPREMERDEVTVTVLTDGGELVERTRTLYLTHQGPILTSILGLPIFPWTSATAFAMGDANADNFRALNHFYDKNRASSVGEIDEILKCYLGIPWVNTIAADRHGDAYYADISVVPHVTDEHAIECNTAFGQATFEALRLPILDGSRSACEWRSDDDAPLEGIFGGSSLPTLTRDDYTSNMNDSYWLTNPREPLTGFETIIGDEETQRTTRTRIGIINVEERLAGEDDLDGDRFTVDHLTEIAFNNRQYPGELVRDELVEMCEEFPGGLAPNREGGLTDVSEACPILADWDLREDLDSVGALVFRRFWTHATASELGPWDESFDADDPVHTPRGLDTENPEVREALGSAVADLEDAGIPLDAPLGDFQYVERQGERIPLHGGPGGLGQFNAMNFQWDADEGYTHIPHGTSYVQVVHFQDGPCPDARTILTYSQSPNPDSPHRADQTRAYADKTWNEIPFCEEDIAADPNLTVEVVRGAALGEPEEEPPTAVDEPTLPATGGGAALTALALLAALVLVRSRWGGAPRWRPRTGAVSLRRDPDRGDRRVR